MTKRSSMLRTVAHTYIETALPDSLIESLESCTRAAIRECIEISGKVPRIQRGFCQRAAYEVLPFQDTPVDTSLPKADMSTAKEEASSMHNCLVFSCSGGEFIVKEACSS